MSKITTIIDIGSNSIRMIVLKKSSRFAFSLLNETKSRVKISEGCYENNGNLQEIPMQRAYESLKSFLNISKALKSRKILCVATSALRDAPNSKIFINKVKTNLKLNIKIIDGKKEAFFGGIAALNLLNDDTFLTVDIGGGSTEFCFVKNKKIEQAISLNIGTVRLKELYFDKNNIEDAKKYILDNLKKIFDLGVDIPKKVVGIGGSIRALSKTIMSKNNYPLDILHGFTYQVQDEMYLIDKISQAQNIDNLKMFGVKKDRFDTIKEGSFIFKIILEFLQTQTVVTSGVGVREGVYLTDLLRNSNNKFPSNFNVSVKSLLDRFQIDEKQSSYLGNNSKKIFDNLKPIHNLKDNYKTLLVIASKLNSIGSILNFYKSNDNAFNFILSGLNYEFLHESRAIVAYTIKFSKKSLPCEFDILQHKELLPPLEIMQWMSFMVSLNIAINQDFSRPNVDYILDNNILKIKLSNKSFLVQSNIEKIETPKDLILEIL